MTKRRPTLEELTDLLFAWRAVRHVRSNAIVLARNGATVGIGAGQASRQVSVEIALRRAGDRAKTRGHGVATPTSRSRTGSRPRPRPASPRSSSRAARSATRWRSRSPTAITWRWCSPADATSATDQPPTRPARETARWNSCSRSRWSASPRRRRSRRRGSWVAASGTRPTRAATEAMRRTMDEIEFAGHDRHRRGRARRGADALHRRARRADRRRTRDDVPAIDIAVDPLEGTNLVAHGQAGAITVLAASEAGGLIHAPDTYMEKLCVGPVAAGKVDIRASPTENLAPDRRGARPAGRRHHGRHPRAAAPRRPDRRGPRRPAPGSSSSATATCRRRSRARSRAPASTRSWASAARPRACITAAALRCLGGEIQARFRYRSDEERERGARMGHGDEDRVYTTEDLAPGENLVFAATGVTDRRPAPGRPLLRRRRADPLAGDGLPDQAGPLRRHGPHVRPRQPAERPALGGSRDSGGRPSDRPPTADRADRGRPFRGLAAGASRGDRLAPARRDEARARGRPAARGRTAAPRRADAERRDRSVFDGSAERASSGRSTAIARRPKTSRSRSTSRGPQRSPIAAPERPLDALERDEEGDRPGRPGPARPERRSRRPRCGTPAGR